MTNQQKLLKEYNANHPSKLGGCLSVLFQLAIFLLGAALFCWGVFDTLESLKDFAIPVRVIEVQKSE